MANCSMRCAAILQLFNDGYAMIVFGLLKGLTALKADTAANIVDRLAALLNSAPAGIKKYASVNREKVTAAQGLQYFQACRHLSVHAATHITRLALAVTWMKVAESFLTLQCVIIHALYLILYATEAWSCSYGATEAPSGRAPSMPCILYSLSCFSSALLRCPAAVQQLSAESAEALCCV